MFSGAKRGHLTSLAPSAPEAYRQFVSKLAVLAPLSARSLNAKKRRRLGLALDVAAGIVVASALSAICIIVADRLWRPDWDFSWADHWMGAPVLYLAPAALLGLAWAHVQLLSAALSRRWRQSLRRRDWVRALFVGVLLGISVWPVGAATFAGSWISDTWLGTWGPWLFSLSFAAASTLCTLIVWRAQRRVVRGARAVPLGVAFAFASFASSALWLDMNVYSDLYPELHALLEYCAMALFFCAFQLIGFVLVRLRPEIALYSRILALALLALGLTFATSHNLRNWTDSHLSHAWIDELYVGRVLRRTQQLELQLTGGETLEMARVDHLTDRFEVKNRTLDARWMQSRHVLGAYPAVTNVVFFYVDTLRADVAADADLMPHLSKFREQSLTFSRAYASGSDTLRSLPAITSGNYFIEKTHSGDLLQLARARGVHSKLVLAQSASEFLKKLLPSFVFDETVEIGDYEKGEDVWGYGANRPTGTAVTDEGVAFLKSEAAHSPFFLWLFHFDQHAWRELDAQYIEQQRSRFGIETKGPHDVRYRVIARSLDEEFGRLLRSLEETGHAKDTAVVFISDHGEGLGQGGFWVHSIFLWESLIHVPLAIRIPGVQPRAVEEPISLVQVAPTLAPIWAKLPPLGTVPSWIPELLPRGLSEAFYHGEDLARPASSSVQSAYPLLLRGGRVAGLDRIGIIDAKSKRKLTIRLEAAFPELHAYEDDPLDTANLARHESHRVAGLLSTLARSPVFPRSIHDFGEVAQELEWLHVEAKGPSELAEAD